MIIGACVGLPLGVLTHGWRSYPWLVVPLNIALIVVMHPVMEKDVPSLIGEDMLSSPRTWIGLVLFAAIMLLSYHSGILKPPSF
jgi:predicted MFS family arabinose efflux permease